MRILLVTPFSPFGAHDHAASDTVVQLVSHLAPLVDLHVFTPEVDPSEVETARARGVTLWNSQNRIRGKFGALLTIRPSWLRQTWARRMTGEVLDLAREIHPDVIHCEYLQTGEVCLKSTGPTVVALHDVVADVMHRRLNNSASWEKGYRLAEYLRTRRFESRVVQAASVPLSISRSDTTHFASLNERTSYVAPGVSIPSISWDSDAHESHTILFAGALWRSANEQAAVRLVTQIMPRVWAQHPHSTVRIVGSRPSNALLELAVDKRVQVVGQVPSFDEEFASASVVASPTVLGGGVLMKVLRPMSIGCPVVADWESGSAIGASESDLSLAHNDRDFSDRLSYLLSDKSAATAYGERARAFIASSHSWQSTTSGYIEAYKCAMDSRVSPC